MNFERLQKYGRAIRVILALLLTAGLLVLMFGLRIVSERVEDELGYAIASTTWNVSEILHESHNLDQALHFAEMGTTEQENVVLHFDLLWSRIDILVGNGMAERLRIDNICREYLAFLTQYEASLTANSPPSVEILRQMQVHLGELRTKLRKAWIENYASLSYRELSERLAQPHASRENLRLAIVAMLVCLIGYLAFEFSGAIRSEAREKQLREAAMQADRAKGDFLSTLSHELRTPLNGVLGMASVLNSTDLDARQRMFVRTITKSGNSLLTLINDVLDYVRIESGHIELYRERTSLHEVISDPIRSLDVIAAKKNICIYGRVSNSLPEYASIDQARVRQILTNMINNAIKFSDQGEILVEVKRATADVCPRGDALLFEVRDQGSGVPPELRSSIFEKFVQVDASITRAHEGVGLGLAISSGLVKLMGGLIGVRTVVGKGSTFWFTVPVVEASNSADPEPARVDEVSTILLPGSKLGTEILLEKLRSLGVELRRTKIGGDLEVFAPADPSAKSIVAIADVANEADWARLRRIASTMSNLTGLVLVGSFEQIGALEPSVEGIPVHAVARPASSAELLEAVQLSSNQHCAGAHLPDNDNSATHLQNKRRSFL